MKVMLTNGSVVEGRKLEGDVARVGLRYLHTYEEDGVVYQDPDRPDLESMCPGCAACGLVTTSETGPDAQYVELDVGSTEPLPGTLCVGCRTMMVRGE